MQRIAPGVDTNTHAGVSVGNTLYAVPLNSKKLYAIRRLANAANIPPTQAECDAAAMHAGDLMQKFYKDHQI